MTAFVTGGTGFTGSHLVNRLLDRGQKVRVLDTSPGLFADQLRKRGAELTIGSVTDAAIVDRLTRGCDRVYHLAAVFRTINVPRHDYRSVNVDGTRIVGEAALRHGVRSFVYCSTQGVHGNIPHPPGNEESPIAPEDYYQQTKYEGELEIRKLADQGLPAVILRPMGIYGPGDPGRFLLLFRMIKRGYFLMFGSGATYFHPLYIDNLLDAFELAGERGGRGEVYLIGDQRYVTLNELVRAVADSMRVRLTVVHLPFAPLWAASVACERTWGLLGIEPPLFRRRADWFRQNRAFSIAKAASALGYQANVSLSTGLIRTARWYAEHGFI